MSRGANEGQNLSQEGCSQVERLPGQEHRKKNTAKNHSGSERTEPQEAGDCVGEGWR